MAYFHDRHECLTGCQDRSPWLPKTDLQYDFIMVYGVDEDMPSRIAKYREKGYVVHLMTGSAWGEYQDYLNGDWDGVVHWDESQMDRHGNPILHGVNVPYLCPTLSFCRYLTEKLLPAVDAGAEAVHLEEPEFWDDGGYSEGFKREYREYYGQEWQPPHLDCETRYKASALKVYLYRRLVEYVSKGLKAYAEKQGRELKFYVPTHSLVNYTQWKILSPEGTLLDIPTVDGYIAQVWTGTSRVGNVYCGQYAERTFETAFLEYGVMQELVRGTGRRMWFLHDPVEDNPEYTWENFRANYLKTVVTSLLHPAVHHYEVSPWPNRVFTGVYPKKLVIAGGMRPGDDLNGAKPIPQEYAELICAMIQTLGDMEQPDASFEEKDMPRIGVFMADSGLYQRTFPDSVPHSEMGVEGLNSAFLEFKRRWNEGECTFEANRELMERICDDKSLYNDYVASGPFPHFFGMAMPLVKSGIPLRPIQFENMSRYQDYLSDYDAVILSYEWMKPRSAEDHAALAEWVRAGGILLYAGDGSDPYHSAKSWWNTGECCYENPAQPLMEELGLGRNPDEGVYAVGRGKAAIKKTSPARITLSEENAMEWREWVRKNAAPGFVWKNHFTMRRGPYRIAAVMEESTDQKPLVLEGSFADLLTQDFQLIRRKEIGPGENALLFDLEAAEPVRIIGTTARIESLEETEQGYRLFCKAAADIMIRMRLKLEKRILTAEAADESGAKLPVACEWNEETSTLLIRLASTNSRTEVRLYQG